MGLLSVLSTLIKMKCFVVLSALVGCGLAAPVADADAQYLLGGTYGHGLVGGAYGHSLVGGAVGHGLVGGVYSAGHAIAAPAVATVAVAHAAPVVHAAPVAIATAPVVHHVGYQVNHHVQHIPQVSVQRHTSTHTTSHVINHAPVVGAALAH